jgi:hypothetical protein
VLLGGEVALFLLSAIANTAGTNRLDLTLTISMIIVAALLPISVSLICRLEPTIKHRWALLAACLPIPCGLLSTLKFNLGSDPTNSDAASLVLFIATIAAFIAAVALAGTFESSGRQAARPTRR